MPRHKKKARKASRRTTRRDPRPRARKSAWHDPRRTKKPTRKRARKSARRRDPSWYKQPRRHAKAAKKGWARRKHGTIAHDPKRGKAARRRRR